MKKRLQLLLLATFAVVGVSATMLTAPSVQAINVFNKSCGGSGGGGAAPTTPPATGTQQGGGGASDTAICGAATDDDVSGLTQNVITTLFVILGAIAVIMIVIGGIRYTTSNGDSSQTKSAKDTIMYAVIGLVVAIMAYAIVSFTLNAFVKQS